MKKLIIIFSLIFVSCQTKTETTKQAEQIQEQARTEIVALPVADTVQEIETGMNTDTLCLD